MIFLATPAGIEPATLSLEGYRKNLLFQRKLIHFRCSKLLFRPNLLTRCRASYSETHGVNQSHTQVSAWLHTLVQYADNFDQVPAQPVGNIERAPAASLLLPNVSKRMPHVKAADPVPKFIVPPRAGTIRITGHPKHQGHKSRLITAPALIFLRLEKAKNATRM